MLKQKGDVLKRQLFSILAGVIFLYPLFLTLDVHGSSQTDSNFKQPVSKTHGFPHPDNFFYGDTRPDAPELASRGPFNVGVRTLKVVNPNQIDILKYSEENTDPRYDRPLTLEAWYPAIRPGNTPEVTTYQDVLGNGPDDPDRPLIPFEFAGRALRDAKPHLREKAYPLIIVCHGYPGSRVLLTYLTENLASKGYVVVAIDHTESTHADKKAFSSTLLNRALDIIFVLNYMPESFLAGVVDVDKTAIIGYSMGGYGALIAAGAGISKTAKVNEWVPGNKLETLQADSTEYKNLLDDRIQAIIPFAPWGVAAPYWKRPEGDTWDTEGLKGISVPSLFIVGNQDRTAVYEGVKYIFENAVNSDRYLLVYQNGIHEVAVNPPPPIADDHFREYMHYQEPAWDNRRCNNINQHFITAFLGIHLKGMQEYQTYLDLIPMSNDADPDTPEYWKGFKKWTAVGLELHHLEP
jgi:predicted dienelactone hydrolase